MISDILSVTNNLKIRNYLVAMDIVKALNSLDHSFSIPILKKFEYGENLIDWIKILLCKQELGILNSASTT